MPDPIELDLESDMVSVFDTALKLGLIEKRGSWYFFGDHNLGQGRKARDLDPKVRSLIYESIPN